MGKEQILDIIERMRSSGAKRDTLLSASINAKLRAGEIAEVYELLEKDNLIIILRSVIRQYERVGKIENLNLQLFHEIVQQKNLQDEVLVNLFVKCIRLGKISIFTEVCDII